MLNRDLLITRYQRPFVDWVNQADPNRDGDVINLEFANEDCPADLIHECASEEFEDCLREGYQSLFDYILAERCTEPGLKPLGGGRTPPELVAVSLISNVRWLETGCAVSLGTLRLCH